MKLKSCKLEVLSEKINQIRILSLSKNPIEDAIQEK